MKILAHILVIQMDDGATKVYFEDDEAPEELSGLVLKYFEGE